MQYKGGQNKMEKKKLSRPVKIGAFLAIAAILAVTGISVYATNSDGKISESEAKQIALSEVKGADTSHITKCEKDFDDDRAEYDIEIIYDGFEYDFEISAEDGTIFDVSKECINSNDQAQNGNQNGNQNGAGKVTISHNAQIGMEEAKLLALAEVPGATKADISKAKKDSDDGRIEYDIEIIYNGYEYEFEIDAKTGEIISKDVDVNDDYYDDDNDDD